MSDLNGTNPFEVGLERGIGWSKDFIGKAALEKIKEKGAKQQLLGFTIDEDDIHIETMSLGSSGAPVIVHGEEVGRVRKVSYGYTIEKNIGYALVDSTKAKIGDKAIINGFEAILTNKVFC